MVVMEGFNSDFLVYIMMQNGLGVGPSGLFQAVLELLSIAEENMVADLINQILVEVVSPVE